MSNSTCRALGLAVLALGLPGCETIKGFFPDKMEDYRYSTEIPPLELPPDLKSDAIKLEDDIHPSQQGAPLVSEAPSDASRETPEKPAEQPQQNMVSWSEGNSRLQLNAGFEKAWLMVAKALTHQAIEITDRDRSQGAFFVRYDPQKYEVKDSSIWDEVAFFFGNRDSHELPYRVRVIENGAQTQVAVTDDNDVAVTQEPGLSLLKLLYETLKADAAGKPKSEGEATEKTGEEKHTDAEQQPSAGTEEKPTTDADGPSKSGTEDTPPAGGEKP